MSNNIQEDHTENCPCVICSGIRSIERSDPSIAPHLKKEETRVNKIESWWANLSTTEKERVYKNKD